MENGTQTDCKHEHATRSAPFEPICITLRIRSTLLSTAQALDMFIDLIRYLQSTAMDLHRRLSTLDLGALQKTEAWNIRNSELSARQA